MALRRSTITYLRTEGANVMGEDLLYQVQVFKFGSEDDEVEGGLGL